MERNIYKIGKELFITSDEEIKEGDWWLNLKTNDVDKCTHKSEVLLYNSEKYEYIKKIILTTDQDLIKDGVQAIDDEFLEWFVKNPSCEKIDFNIKYNCKEIGNCIFDSYKIIIPKEEQDYTALLKQVGTKQETPEEVAERLYLKTKNQVIDFANELRKEGFLKCAKWQQKRMYSEEDMKQFGLYLGDNFKKLKGKTIDEIFEQFIKR